MSEKKFRQTKFQDLGKTKKEKLSNAKSRNEASSALGVF